MTDQNFYKVIITKIKAEFPEWCDWYATLDQKKREHLNKRMNIEMESFIKVGMWEYAEFAAYRNSNRKQIEEKKTYLDKDELLSLNNKLKKQYGFDLMQPESLTTKKNTGKYKL